MSSSYGNARMNDLREEINNINKQVKLLLGDFLSRKGVVSISDRFVSDELTNEFLREPKDESDESQVKLYDLILERNEISAKIAKKKEKKGLSITNLDREKEVIDAFCSGVNPDVMSLYKTVAEYLVNLSKFVQYQTYKVKPPLQGEIEMNADKSMVHRFLIFSAVAVGETVLRGNISGLDVYSTIKCLRQLGVNIKIEGDLIRMKNPNAPKLTKPEEPLNAGNSGTTMRLLCGLLAGQGFECQIIGDESLSRRPMDRVVEPLRLMGADIECRDGKYAPIHINKNIFEAENQQFDNDADITSDSAFKFDTTKYGRLLGLTSIDYQMPVASSQVKTAMMLADLYTGGRSKITEPSKTRDHSEILLKKMGYQLPLESLGNVYVPGDISSAAYYLVGALLIPGSNITVKNTLINQLRIKYLEVLSDMDADINTNNISTGIEIFGDFVAEASSLTGTTITKENVASVIDEISILAVAAAFATGTTVIESPDELRLKESDRLQGIIDNLGHLGIKISLKGKDLVVKGNPKKKLNKKNLILDSENDHRMAMTYAILALKSNVPIEITGINSTIISNPEFLSNLTKLFG